MHRIEISAFAQLHISAFANASRSVWEYFCSTGINALETHATMLRCSESFVDFCAKITLPQTGLASQTISVCFLTSKYDIPGYLLKTFYSVSIAVCCGVSHLKIAFYVLKYEVIQQLWNNPK